MDMLGFLPNGLSGPPVLGDLSLGDAALCFFFSPPFTAPSPGLRLADRGGRTLSGLGGEGGMNASWLGVGDGGQNGADENEFG